MNKESIQRFELTDIFLQYDYTACTLLCKNAVDGKNLWIRKIEDGGFIFNILENKDKVFISIETEGNYGQFLVLNKRDGITSWFIPGKAYMSCLYCDSIYLIFADNNNDFFLIKTSTEDGSKLWHHAVEDHLAEYAINNNAVILKYLDGSTETISNSTGLPL